MLPDVASIHMAAADKGAVNLSFWEDVYGFSYKPVQQQLRDAELSNALVLPVKREDLLTQGVTVQQLDLASMTAADADLTADFVLEADPQVTSRP